ncbi:MAG TPA: ABC transporter ATP-binding protein, partial [Opitutae bacterium]|nr:ABC transporter ATP-binding protein [Opitutae bacterium]
MNTPVIEVNELSKRYQLGSIGHQSLRDSLESYWRKIFNKAPITNYEDNTGGRWEAEGPRAKSTLPKSIWALNKVSFSLQAGETLGIIGRNGAGKSTLLKVLSRITEPTNGSARVQGRVASLLEVGTGFHPELTGRENIFLNGAILGMKRSEIKKKFDEIVHFSEVEAFIDTPVKRYSIGMTVRLAFAVAAHLDSD